MERKKGFTAVLGVSMLALVLAACGGGDDGGGSGSGSGGSSGAGSGQSGGGTATTSGFTQSAKWTFTLPASGSAVCYDFNAKAEVAGCTGNAWDLKVTAASRSATLWTNSGTSGSGAGGAFGGPFDHTWAGLLTWKNATTDPVNGTIPATLFFKDAASGVFAGTNDIGSAVFEYGVAGSSDHLLYPNYRTILITSDSTKADPVGSAAAPVFALQVTGYYGGASGTTSGNPSFRWVDRSAPATVRTATVNAASDWVYFDLSAGAVTTAGGNWHIAFNRYNIKLNGGESGSGKVAGFLAKTPAGFYDGSGKPVAAKFTDASSLAATQSDLGAADLLIPADQTKWVKDGTASRLNPTYTGTYPGALNYGWYTYYPSTTAAAAAGLPAVAHLLKANPENASLLRGGEGTTYARFHVTKIAYADPNNSSSAQTWTIEFDVQP